MAGQSWSILIKGSNPASFDPDVYGTDPGQPLKAQLGDLVSWNNQTRGTHQIWLTDEKGKQLENGKVTDKIAKYKSSFPGYVTQLKDVRPPVSATTKTGTIYYQCSLHPKEKGQIKVVS